MLKIGLWINSLKPQCMPAARLIYERISSAGSVCVQLLEADRSAQYHFIPMLTVPLRESKCDVVIVLGGDGTLLSAARIVAPEGIPMLGINLGHRGFMATAEAEELGGVMDALLSGQGWVEERLMLQASIGLGGQDSLTALNEFGLFHSQRRRMLQLAVYIDGERADEYYADGVLVSTPTGSTAYSLSAGGPLVVPKMDCIVVIPVCANSLHTRPIVLPPTSRVELRVMNSRPEPAQLTADGQVDVAIPPDGTVLVQAAPWQAKLLRFDDRSFFEVLRQKMNEWGAALDDGDGGRR